jgi:hypothetical protein
MTGGETGIDQISMPEVRLANPAEEIRPVVESPILTLAAGATNLRLIPFGLSPVVARLMS